MFYVQSTRGTPALTEPTRCPSATLDESQALQLEFIENVVVGDLSELAIGSIGGEDQILGVGRLPHAVAAGREVKKPLSELEVLFKIFRLGLWAF